MASVQQYNLISWMQFLETKALEFKLTPTQTRVFLTRFDRENWLSKIEDIWQLSDVNSFEAFVKHSTNIYKILKPNCPKISKGAGNFIVVRDWLLQEYDHLPNDDRLSWISDSELTSVEIECHQAILQPGALIRIKAPSKMGKTRLLNSILDRGNHADCATVHINLLQIESSKFENLNLFLRWFCIYITDALKLDLELDCWWSKDRGSMLSCTRYLDAILQTINKPLILGLDEVDRLLNYPQISQDFFYLLRSWYEESNSDELWENLRLIIVYSTKDFGSLDINQSPFNVGLPIELQSFDHQQIEHLANSYKLNFNSEELTQIQTTFGGHPYLTDLTLCYLAVHKDISLTELLVQATQDNSIYSNYLRQHLVNLKNNQELTQVFQEILRSPQPIAIDTILGYQLYRMGLIKWSVDNKVMPSCELYKQYFLSRLNIKH